MLDIKFIRENKDKTLKEVFPELFKVELIVGEWYCYELNEQDNILFNFQGVYSQKNNSGAYGFTVSRQWFENLGVSKEDVYRKATPEEVEDALIKEAEKRGFKEEVYVKYPWFKDSEVDKIYKPFYIKGNTYLDGDSFYYNNVKVFKSGIWADIIPTITKSEAEKRLNCKIVD